MYTVKSAGNELVPVDDGPYSAVFRSSFSPGSVHSGHTDVTCKSLYSVFLRGLDTAGGHAPCVGSIKKDILVWQSYDTIHRRALNFGSGLLSLSLVPLQTFIDEPYGPAQRLRPIGILLANCEEWLIADIAAAAYGFTLVPLYLTLGKTAMQTIIEETKLETIITTLKDLNDHKSSFVGYTSIKTIITVPDDQDSEDPINDEDLNLDLKSFAEIEGQGTTLFVTPPPIDPSADRSEQVHIIRYTSGTTGRPKGVMETHGNFLTAIGGIRRNTRNPDEPSPYLMKPGDRYFSHLPLAHLLDHLMCIVSFDSGASIVCSTGQQKRFFKDLQIANPTVLGVVPRLLSHLQAKAQSEVCKLPKPFKYLFHLAENLRQYTILKYPAEAILQYFARPIIGGKVRVINSAGAALAGHLQDSITATFGAKVIQAYGMTECMNPLLQRGEVTDVDGTVGGPTPCVEVCLKKLTGFGDDQIIGEFYLRGAVTTPGYFRNPSQTATELLVPARDGGLPWLRTGDIMSVDEMGRFTVVGRTKCIFKLAQGEYIAPTKIEDIYLQSPYIQQVYVDGNSSENYLVGVVVPNITYMAQTGFDMSSINNDDLYELIKREMRIVDSQLCGFEKLKKIIIDEEPFSIENELLTPTLKLKRTELYKKYEAEFDYLYNHSDQYIIRRRQQQHSRLVKPLRVNNITNRLSDKKRRFETTPLTTTTVATDSVPLF